jgi:hypothetical protein
MKSMKNQKFIRNVFFILFLVTISACEETFHKHFTGSFPEKPINLLEFNTEYDDYNSNISIYGETFPLLFSSTRNSKGANYDIVYKLMSVEFNEDNGILNIYNNTSSNLDVYIENAGLNGALNKINTSFNEFGPYLIPLGRNFNGTNMNGRFETYIFLYSTNASGNQDIMFTQNLENEFYELPLEVEFLNSESDDAYPTFNKDYSEIYFTSNREGDFDIFRAKTDNSKEILEIVSGKSPVSVEKDTVLSSGFDDKCPYISQDFMVFTSNRDGGFGGYDLYYSRFENGKWGEPINFGAKINTEFDEYRPIVRSQSGFPKDFMIFSSDRPGGKGGFDLYFVGIEKIIN